MSFLEEIGRAELQALRRIVRDEAGEARANAQALDATDKAAEHG